MSLEPTDDDEMVTLFLGASRSITIGRGSSVLIEETDGEAYGAVIVRIVDCYVELTFTPPEKPRKVPLGQVVCSIGDESATVDLSSIPEYQPAPNVAPRRSRRVRVLNV